MRNSRRLMMGLIGAGLLGGAALSGGVRAQDNPPAKALKIAVLNMSECMEPARNEHARDLAARFDGINNEAKLELQRIRKKADELKVKAKSLEDTPSSALYIQVFSEWSLEEAKLKIAQEVTQRQLLATRDSFRTELYSDARKIATLVAQEQKIDLVLRGDEGAFEEDKSDLALQKNMLRSVLYHDPSLDITAAVLARLNDDFKKKRGVAAICPKCKIAGKDGKCPKCGEQIKN
jgi:Skp family chaperone for outer membrane proteins